MEHLSSECTAPGEKTHLPLTIDWTNYVYTAYLKCESIEPKSISSVCFYAENLYQMLIIYIETFLYLMGKCQNGLLQ